MFCRGQFSPARCWPLTGQCTMGKCTSGVQTQKGAFQQLFDYLEKPYFVNISLKTDGFSYVKKDT